MARRWPTTWTIIFSFAHLYSTVPTGCTVSGPKLIKLTGRELMGQVNKWSSPRPNEWQKLSSCPLTVWIQQAQNRHKTSIRNSLDILIFKSRRLLWHLSLDPNCGWLQYWISHHFAKCCPEKFINFDPGTRPPNANCPKHFCKNAEEWNCNFGIPKYAFHVLSALFPVTSEGHSCPKVA